MRLSSTRLNYAPVEVQFNNDLFFQTRLEGIHRTLNSEESTLTQTKSDGLSDALRDLSTRKFKTSLFQDFVNLYF